MNILVKAWLLGDIMSLGDSTSFPVLCAVLFEVLFVVLCVVVFTTGRLVCSTLLCSTDGKHDSLYFRTELWLFPAGANCTFPTQHGQMTKEALACKHLSRDMSEAACMYVYMCVD